MCHLSCYSPKSNASYLAIGTAQQLVKQTGDLPIPIHLRNAPTKLMKELGYGEEYKYSMILPTTLLTKNFYLIVKTPRSTFRK
jgi:replication-associated recombination protein RarA